MKISQYSENTNPSLNDFALGETASGPSTNRFKYLNLLNLFFNNPPSNATGFAGLVQSQGNSGTAGGTIYYIDLFGIKLLWAESGNYATGAGGTSQGSVILPASFFSTLQLVNPSLLPSTVSQQYVNVNAANTTSITIQTINTTGSNATSNQFWLFVIGT